MKKFPVFAWKDATEKEWAFKQLIGLGYYRDDPKRSVDHEWINLTHTSDLFYMEAGRPNAYPGSRYENRIYFNKIVSPHHILFNSARHMIDYIKKNKVQS